VLLRATRAEAAFGLTDIRRIGTLLARVKGQIRHRRLDQVSPLAVPALIEVGREWVAGGAEDALLAEAAALIEEATGEPASLLEIQPAGLEEFTSQGDRDRRGPTRRPPRTARSRRRG